MIKQFAITHEEKSSEVRGNKYISESGCTSRRESDKLIESGKVKVKDIQNKSISVTVYDYRLNKNNYTRYTANDLHQALISYKANLSQLQTDSPNNWVSEVVDSSSNQVITDAYLSDYYNNSLTLYIRTESDESDE